MMTNGKISKDISIKKMIKDEKMTTKRNFYWKVTPKTLYELISKKFIK